MAPTPNNCLERTRERKSAKAEYIPSEDCSELLGHEAAQLNIDVILVPESELLVFIAEARQGFSAEFEEDL